MTRLIIPATSIILAFVVVLVLAPSPAVSQDAQALLDRIERLERDIRTLNTQISRGDGAVVETGEDSNLSAANTGVMSGAGIARIDARITSLENDVRATTGAFEDLDHRIYELSTMLEKLVADVDFRLSEIEQKIGGSPLADATMQQGIAGTSGSATPQVSTVAPAGNVTQAMSQPDNSVLGTITESDLLNATTPAATPSETQPATQATATESEAVVETAVVAPPAAEAAIALSPQDQYTQAFGLLRQAKYDDATIALQAFVNQHPGDPLAANARYWLGETYYVRSEFVRAAEIFFEGYRTAPDGPKAPDTLLKLGMALGNLGKKPEACAAFTKLADEFPNASTNVRNTMERERLRNGC
jgi:tol-pal system protein YbgF